MNTYRLGILLVVFVLDAALLLIVGATMWSEPPSPADGAVGKGLMTLGAALCVPAFVCLCALLDSRDQTAYEQEAAGSDWDTV